jgi:flagellar biosynthesis chaperone FliJ
MMKKIIVVLLLSFMPLLPSSGQTPVSDVVHTTSTTLGHFKSLEEAIKSGVQLLNQLTVLKQTYEGMKAIKETFDKINQYIYNIQEIVDAAQSLINIIQRTSDIYRQAVRSNTFSLKELTFLMDYLTSAIEQGTRNVEKIKDYVTSSKWRFTDKERIDEIEDAESEIEKIEESLENTAENLESISETRKKIEYMNANGMFTPMETYVVNVTGRMTLGAELTHALSMALGQSTETDTARSAAKKTTDLYGNLKTLFFALSAFIALIGAFRVYRKVNLEEDGLGKTATIWFTSALTVFILGSIVELFLF